MTIADDIQARLDELFLIYNEIRQKRLQWENLQTVDLARAEYERLTVQEDEKLAELKRNKENLKKEKLLLILESELKKDNIELTRSLGSTHMEYWHPPQTNPVELRTPEGKQSANVVRDEFIKLVNRWRYSWRLNPTILGQINCIAEDADRPLGEALMLLDWNVFADSSRTQESLEMRLTRLNKWAVVLAEYRDWLNDNIGKLEMRFRGWLPIWEIWRVRDRSAQEQAT